MNAEKEKVTIFYTSEFGVGVQKVEGTLLNFGVTPEYAQFKNVPFVEFIPKGKRKGCRIQKGYNPFLVIVKGWDIKGEPDAYIHSESNGFNVSESKYLSHDPRYKTDFNTWINHLIESNNIIIIADYRHIKEVKV